MARTRVRWGRIVGVAVAVSLGMAGVAARGHGSSSVTTSTRPVAVRVHIVRSGETLWSIARSVVGREADPRPEVDALVRANHLGSSDLHVGDRLILPSA